MPTIDRTVTTSTSQESVWAFLADFRTTEQWDPPTRRTIREVGDGGVGTVYRNTSALLGHETEIVYRVLEHDPPGRLVLRGETEAFTATDTILVVADGAGSTVHYTAEFELQGTARLAAPLAPLALRKIGDDAAAQMQRCLDAL